MPDSASHQDRNVEGIFNHVQDYLAVRVQQAIRINPRVANVIDDIVWAQMANLRHVLQKPKGFGPERIRVADILASDIELRRKALFSFSDQNSIIYEIVNKSDEQKRAMAELAIHNMRTFFRALDPSLEMIVELIQHWILWDLPDATILFNFDEQMRRCNAVRTIEINEDLRNRYRTALHKRPEDPLSDADIITLEFKRLEHMVQGFIQRRAEEEAFMAIIRRDEQAGSASAQQIKKIAEQIRVLEELESGDGSLDASVAAHYAGVLHVLPDAVTCEAAADYEKKMIADGKRMLERYMQDDRFLGEPYDYKKRQAEILRERYSAEAAKCQQRLGAAAEHGSGAAVAGHSHEIVHET